MRISAITRPHALRPLGGDEHRLRRLHHITDVRANEDALAGASLHQTSEILGDDADFKVVEEPGSDV